MANVLGIPLIKGNSHAILSANLSAVKASDKIKEGTFCAKVGGTIEAEVANIGEGALYGLALDINPYSKRLSVTRSCELVLVRTDGTAPALGSPVLVNVDGLVSATGTIQINGEVMGELETGKDGKAGEEVENCILISMNTLMGVTPVVAAATATAKASTAKK